MGWKIGRSPASTTVTRPAVGHLWRLVPVVMWPRHGTANSTFLVPRPLNCGSPLSRKRLSFTFKSPWVRDPARYVLACDMCNNLQTQIVSVLHWLACASPYSHFVLFYLRGQCNRPLQVCSTRNITMSSSDSSQVPSGERMPIVFSEPLTEE